VATEEEDLASHGDDVVIEDETMSANESEAESSEAELGNKWTSPICAFFKHTPDIEYVNGRWCHVFHCEATSCKERICCFLDKKDAGSTSNLHKHAESCWGAASVKAVTDL
jgi:hypothetical protein